jgi:protein tyrosine phosphatase (PTP) superfamily phosphohydrolase (DUF442 family)
MSFNDIYNVIQVSDEIVTSGQPTADQLRSLAEDGFTTVINLTTIDPHHSLADEAGLVQALGLHYYHIPVDWRNPQESDFLAFEQVMTRLLPGKTLIHCAANFRVTAFYSLFAQKHLGWSAAQADAFRARIWAGSVNPVWEAFIARIRRQISAG